MIVVVLATLEEAEPVLSMLKAEKLLDRPFVTYGFDSSGKRPGGLVVISGIGLANAGAATEYAIKERGASLVINAGLCGLLSGRGKPGDLFRVSSVSDGNAILHGLQANPISVTATGAWQSIPAVRLVSVREPVFGGEARQKLALNADAIVVDMEGFAVAQTCAGHGVSFFMLKGVSDLANDGGREELKKNMHGVMSSIACELQAGLERLNPPSPGIFRKMANFVKVEHTIFSLPLLFAGAWIGAGGRMPEPGALALIIAAGLGARTLGMAMNRIMDRRFDVLNPRTVNRELPSGKMTPAQAWIVAGAGLILYLLACAALGPLCLWLSPVPAAVLIMYSLLKRFTSLCHFGIGLCLALGPPGAFVAVTGSIAAPPALIYLALFTFCWISGFDIIYALQDINVDRAIGVHSLPSRIGRRGAGIVALITHLVAVISLLQLWRLSGGGIASGLALACAVAAFSLAHYEKIPLHVRFFPISAIAGIAGSLVSLLA